MFLNISCHSVASFLNSKKSVLLVVIMIWSLVYLLIQTRNEIEYAKYTTLKTHSRLNSTLRKKKFIKRQKRETRKHITNVYQGGDRSTALKRPDTNVTWSLNRQRGDQTHTLSIPTFKESFILIRDVSSLFVDRLSADEPKKYKHHNQNKTRRKAKS